MFRAHRLMELGLQYPTITDFVYDSLKYREFLLKLFSQRPTKYLIFSSHRLKDPQFKNEREKMAPKEHL